MFFLKAKRDFWAMTAHHVGAIALAIVSWNAGAFNIGTIVITLHDGSDLILDFAKAARYANKHKTFNSAFALFVLYWFTLRMYIYPFWILRQ